MQLLKRYSFNVKKYTSFFHLFHVLSYCNTTYRVYPLGTILKKKKSLPSFPGKKKMSVLPSYDVRVGNQAGSSTQCFLFYFA